MNKFLKIFGAGLVVVLVFLGIYQLTNLHSPSSATSPQEALGAGDVQNTAWTFTQGLNFGSQGAGVNNNWVNGKQASTDGGFSAFAYWKNTTGKTVYIDNLDVATDGVASSTYKLYAYATSTASTTSATGVAGTYARTLYDFTAPANNGTTRLIIDGALISTSSVATTTSNLDKAYAPRVTLVPNNSYVFIQLQPNPSTAGGCSGLPGLCESATSTKRGFNIFWRLMYHD